MTNYTNDDLYQIVLDRLRKDRKGSINPEEFESFLNNRSLDYFNQQSSVSGVSLLNIDSMAPFIEYNSPVALAEEAATDTFYATLPTSPAYAHLEAAFMSASSTNFASLKKVDIITSAERLERLSDALTAPSIFYPTGYIAGGRIWIDTGWPAGTYVVLTYIKYPAKAIYDYYTDANGNITYLTEGQAAYTLLTGEVSRSGLTAGQAVTSTSIDLEWQDQDAMNIVDMVMTDASLAQSDSQQYQGSIVERQNDVKN